MSRETHHYHIDLTLNRFSPFALSKEERDDYTHDVLWALYDSPEMLYLKQSKVTLWDGLADQEKALYGDYTPIQRISLYGTPELGAEFFNYIGDFIKTEPTEDWVEDKEPVIIEEVADEQFVRKDETKRWVHPQINEIGHAWLDLKGLKGAAKEIVLGPIKSGFEPNTLEGLKAFTNADLDETVIVQKRLPATILDGFKLELTKRDIKEETLCQMLIDLKLAKTIDEAKPLLKLFRDKLPEYEIEARVNLVELTDPKLFTMALFQAMLMTRIAAHSLNLICDGLYIESHHEFEGNQSLHSIFEAEVYSTHLFIQGETVPFHLYQFNQFEFM